MKTYEKPELLELAISNTQSGGSNLQAPDSDWSNIVIDGQAYTYQTYASAN